MSGQPWGGDPLLYWRQAKDTTPAVEILSEYRQRIASEIGAWISSGQAAEDWIDATTQQPYNTWLAAEIERRAK